MIGNGLPKKISLMNLGHGVTELHNQGKKSELIEVIDVLLASCQADHITTLFWDSNEK